MVLPDMQAAGGRSPFPVSSYTTSTPDAEYTRNTVWPKHEAPAYSALHIDAVNVCPALAVTPQSAKLVVSALVFIVSRKGPQTREEVGATVGAALGSRLGAVGRTVGAAVGCPSLGALVGKAGVGRGDGTASRIGHSATNRIKTNAHMVALNWLQIVCAPPEVNFTPHLAIYKLSS